MTFNEAMKRSPEGLAVRYTNDGCAIFRSDEKFAYAQALPGAEYFTIVDTQTLIGCNDWKPVMPPMEN